MRVFKSNVQRLCLIGLLLASPAVLTAPEATSTIAPPVLHACEVGNQPRGRAPGTRADDPQTLLNAMSLEEKLGQLVQTDIHAITPDEARKYCIGSIISTVPDGSLQTAAAWRALADKYQAAALGTRLGIPITFGIDAVHGHSYFDGPSVILPHNIGLGATRNPELIQALARLTAKELLATGVRWTFSPSISVARDLRWGRVFESFGQSPELQTLFARPSITGYQGSNGPRIEYVAATAKHFLADGGTEDGIDRGNAVITDAELRARHLPGFRVAVDEGVAAIMASFSSVNGVKVHGSHKLLTNLLKEELGFRGVVVSDWEGVTLSGLTLAEGMNAGIDQFMFAESWRESLPKLSQAVREGAISQERLDDAVLRILTMKEKLGLLDRPFASSEHEPLLGSDSHRALARQAVRESLVLLKNRDSTLPLKPRTPVFVYGEHAINVAYQSGGWTKKWQGAHADLFGNPAREIAGATSILEGLIHLNGSSHTQFITSMAELTPTENRETLVVVTGETPYAEMFGDRAPDELRLDPAIVDEIAHAKRLGYRITLVLISGRPLLISEVETEVDAIVAAWLPGSEGLGIAEVLFGLDNFRGRLGFDWPRSATQIEQGLPATADWHFPYGFGLSYPQVPESELEHETEPEPVPPSDPAKRS